MNTKWHPSKLDGRTDNPGVSQSSVISDINFTHTHNEPDEVDLSPWQHKYPKECVLKNAMPKPKTPVIVDV
jgi:hypothetical protein